MVVLRVRRGGFVLLLSVLLAACNGSTESNSVSSGALTLSGSVGDGPVVGADVVVTDARGRIVQRLTSDSLANYQLTLPAGTELPVLVTASGGTDLVTGRPLDFELVGAALEGGNLTVNLSPMTTVAVRAAQCSAEGLNPDTLEAAWSNVHGRLAMGLDATLVADPMGDAVTEANVEAVVLANEALGETVRRAATALVNAGSDVTTDGIVDQLACDLADRPATPDGVAVDDRVVTTFKAAELAVRLETLAGRLEVDGASAVSAMNDAIRTIMPEFPAPAVERVAVTAAARDQALALLAVFQETMASDELVALSVALDGAATEGVASRVDAALTPSLHGDLITATTNLAYADRTTLTRLVERHGDRRRAPRPAVSLAAAPAEVAAGGSSTLSWASSDADRCVASGGWSGNVDLQGTASTGKLQQSTGFTLSCAGLGGTTRRSVQVSVAGTTIEPEPEPQPEPQPQPTPAPTVDLSAADTSISAGTSARLSWTSSNATSCSAGGGWTGVRATSGDLTVGPLNTTAIFTLTCSGAGGTGSDSVVVTVDVPTPAPTVNLSAASTSIVAGSSAQLSWSSSNATSCSASGGWSGTRGTSGSESTGPLSATTSYTLTCTGAGGTGSDSVAVTVQSAPAPTLSLQAASATVTAGASTQLSWTSSNATSCSASGGWSGSRKLSGNATVGPINQTTSYKLSCSGAGGSVTRKVTVTTQPAAQPTVSLSASDAVVGSGDTTRLTWSSTNATSCSASGGWSGSRATSGSWTTGPLSRQTTFTLSCSGSGGSAMQMISVAVNGVVALQWQAPTENTDGSPLTDLNAYRIYYGQTSGNYSKQMQVSGSASSYSVALPSGDYYFAMTAVDGQGNESGYSNEVLRSVP